MMPDRRPTTDDNARVKRRRTMSDSDSDSGSDGEGGVSLDPKEWGNLHKVQKEEPPKAPNRKKQRKPKEESSEPKFSVRSGQSKAELAENGFKARQTPGKTEPLEIKYNPYLAHLDDDQNFAKTEVQEAKYNPYLAHRDAQMDDKGYSNGYGHGAKSSRVIGPSNGTTIGHFPRHETTSAMAKKAEDGPNNPFTGKPLSTQYFNILKTRRNLPVHAQRSAPYNVERMIPY